MTTQKRIRPFSLWQLLSLNRNVLWQLTIGLTMLMLALSLAITNAPVGGFLMGGAGLLVLLWGGYNTLYLAEHDLPLLREGTLVAARVTGVVKKEPNVLYRISYRLPGEYAERDGVFAPANDPGFAEGEPVAIMIDPANPEQLVEVSGRYEPLFEKKKKPQQEAA